ncbi:hypothetical protein MNB_SUP05-7-1280 [hydrothermal vent metagenome]|uniref:Uncharacterized protein n=1 Tax=hydrothermal vent metagenome TaxID=652676 RepID=A0A1W1DSN6_9ZZZZ
MQKNNRVKIVAKADRLFVVLIEVNFSKNKIKATKIAVA